MVHRGAKEQPAIDQLLPDAGVDGVPDGTPDELRHVVGEKCPRGDLKRVGVGLIAHKNPFGRDEKNAQSVV